MARKKNNPDKPIPENVVGLPVKNKRISGKLNVYTCDCGGQLFVLFQSGHVLCSSCRTRQVMVKMKLE